MLFEDVPRFAATYLRSPRKALVDYSALVDRLWEFIRSGEFDLNEDEKEIEKYGAVNRAAMVASAFGEAISLCCLRRPDVFGVVDVAKIQEWCQEVRRGPEAAEQDFMVVQMLSNMNTFYRSVQLEELERGISPSIEDVCKAVAKSSKGRETLKTILKLAIAGNSQKEISTQTRLSQTTVSEWLTKVRKEHSMFLPNELR